MILNTPLAPHDLDNALPSSRSEALIGACAVYRDRRLDLDRLVAIKIIPETEAQPPEISERFRLARFSQRFAAKKETPSLFDSANERATAILLKAVRKLFALFDQVETPLTGAVGDTLVQPLETSPVATSSARNEFR